MLHENEVGGGWRKGGVQQEHATILELLIVTVPSDKMRAPKMARNWRFLVESIGNQKTFRACALAAAHRPCPSDECPSLSY